MARSEVLEASSLPHGLDVGVLDPHDGSIVRSNIVFKLGVAAIVLGVFGLLLESGLPDLALVAGGFAVAALAIWLGLRVRGDE